MLAKLLRTHQRDEEQKLLAKVPAGSKNVSFGEMVGLVEAFVLRLSRVTGSHIFVALTCQN
jgi:hypothetical protein